MLPKLGENVGYEVKNNNFFDPLAQCYQIRLTIVYRVKSSSFTLLFLVSPALFSPISAVRGTSSRSLSSNVLSFLLYACEAMWLSPVLVPRMEHQKTHLLLFSFADWVSPEIIHGIRGLPFFHSRSSSCSIAYEVDSYDDLDNDEAVQYVNTG